MSHGSSVQLVDRFARDETMIVTETKKQVDRNYLSDAFAEADAGGCLLAYALYRAAGRCTRSHVEASNRTHHMGPV